MNVLRRVQRALGRRLWRRLNKAHPITSAPPVTLKKAQDDLREAGKVAWDQIISLLKGETPARGKYEWPERLPGVRPSAPPAGDKLTLAMDAGYEEMPMAMDDALPAAWGFSQANAIGPGVAFLGFPYLAELAQISEYRIPAESLSQEMTRTWIKLKNLGKGDKKAKLEQLDKAINKFKVRELCREAALKTEQFGRSHIFISVDGQDDDVTRQLPLTKIDKGKLKAFRCIEPYWLTPYSWNSTHPERPDFYKPQSWFVLGRKTHHTRLCTFIFREVPDLLKPAYDFAGISITQLMMPYVNRWLRTAKNVNDLINIFSIVTLATDLQTLLQNPTEFVKRLQTLAQGRDNRGVLAINKDTEELTINDASLASLDKLQAQAQEHMATPGRMPLIKFFGIVPSGLNANSDGEFQSWYGYVGGMRCLGLDPHISRMLEFIQMNEFGEVDPDIGYEWESLYEPTPKEEGEMRKADAERDSGLIQDGVVDPDEVRTKLKNDPKSGYGDLQGDAPGPPAPPMPEGGGPEPEVEPD